MKKLPFPNHLNSPRVILYWSIDELKFVFMVATFTFATLFALNANTVVIFVSVLIVVPVSYVGYKRLTKDQAPGWLDHYLHRHSLTKGVEGRFLKKHNLPLDDDTIPPGFVTTFED